MNIIPPDWSDVKEDIVKEIIRQAEIHVTQQGAAAQSLEQRALSLSTMTNTAAVAVLAFLSTIWINNKAELPIVVAALATACCWFAAALMALRSASPQEFYLPGRSPSSWYQACSYSIHDCLGVIAEEMDRWIIVNEYRNIRAVNWLKRSLWTATAAPLVGAAVWLITYWSPFIYPFFLNLLCHP